MKTYNFCGKEITSLYEFKKTLKHLKFAFKRFKKYVVLK